MTGEISTTRRNVLRMGLAGGAGMAGYALTGNGWALAKPKPSPTAALASYAQPLQVPPLLDMTAGGSCTLTATPLTRQLHPALPMRTHVWSYVSPAANSTPYDGYLGPTVVVKKGMPVTASYVNGLAGTGGSPATYGVDAPWLPCDLNLTMDHDDRIRLLAHLHGGFVHGQMDGNPAVDVGYLSGETQTVWYGNEQNAALLWYHDHGMGNTRLNVWAGLAGAYLVRDDIDTGLADNVNGLPTGYGTGPGNYEIPLVFQDRQFVNSATSGDFLYPTLPAGGNVGSFGTAGMAPNAYGTANGPWTAEAFGNEGLVNGLVAPYLDVEPRLYRFRCLNGCNARILDLQLFGGTRRTPRMYVIGNDGGMLPAPVKVSTLTMMPGERYDVLIDFTGSGGRVQLKNTNLNGFYTSPAPALTDFLQFNVGTTVTSTANNAVPTTLIGGSVANVGAATVPARIINLWEMNAMALHWWMGLHGTGGTAGTAGTPGGDVDVPVGGFPDAVNGWNANTFHQPVGERPPLGGVQEWDFVNNTADSHPMHMHLVQFQVLHRRKAGSPLPANGAGVPAWEQGWKDTVAVHPGQVTRVLAKFDLPPTPPPAGTTPPSGFVDTGTSPHYQLDPLTREAERCYVYHCHILEHEENDMMRPFVVS